ncbi:UDP-2,4-diacetamido-2,4,6-trideoxy-beta-L-altropyranose hydrolase [Alteromonas aestuariivivens]|nr:UDP-2,4-diacetamido-2,4,6-trideoxy-beta-L-altropyranose hydrolase [Alteromonas aestuariivivens]
MIICTDANEQIGVGHLFRCIALAQAAAHQGVDCHFVLTSAAARISDHQRDWSFAVSESSPEDCFLTLCDLLEQPENSVLVLDGYKISREQLKKLRSKVKCIVALDDGEFRYIEFADIVVNPASRNLNNKYIEIQPSVHCCTGSSYRLLRQEFCNLNPLPVQCRQGIVLCFGGSDPAGLTIKLLQALDEVGARVPIRVITGAAYPTLQELKSLIPTLDLPIEHSHQCQDMAQAWSSARLAISAAGGSQFELGVCQTPSVLVTVANNQLAASERAAKEGWCRVVDKSISMRSLATLALTLYGDDEVLKTMQAACSKFYDAQGAFRVINCIREVLNDCR